jgi:hypothetical protein
VRERIGVRYFFRDVKTKKLAIWGVFDAIGTDTVPAVHPSLCVLATLTNGRGVRNVGISIEKASDGVAVIEIGGPMQFQSPLDIVEFGIIFKNLTFLSFGKYWVSVKEDGRIIAQRPFFVRKVKKPKKQRGSSDGHGNDEGPTGPR